MNFNGVSGWKRPAGYPNEDAVCMDVHSMDAETKVPGTGSGPLYLHILQIVFCQVLF